jgi:hypothetical protein
MHEILEHKTVANASMLAIGFLHKYDQLCWDVSTRNAIVGFNNAGVLQVKLFNFEYAQEVLQ